jgi:DNA-binding transcriptional ArsR family regulator
MSVHNNTFRLHFPCDCVSEADENYSDPWAGITKSRLLGGGTKEEILNLISDSPKTISQLANALNLSAPSVYKHVNELLASELIRDSAEWEKLHPKERYYEPNFPVVDAAECARVEAICEELSDEFARLFEERLSRFDEAFQKTSIAKKGWSLQDISQCLYARIQRNTRRMLEKRGTLQTAQPHKNGITWAFWAEKVLQVNQNE